MEVLDIYDEKKNCTGKTITTTSESKLGKDEYFLCVQCWIVNSSREILLTQRRKNKENGGKWEPTGGCVISGETSLEGMKRELNEEIGIDVKKGDLILIKTIQEKREARNCFRDIYILKKNIAIRDLKFNDGEVVDSKYVTINEFEEMIQQERINHWLNFFIEEYHKLYM